MSVGDLHDVEHTGEFAVAKQRIRRRRAAPQPPTERTDAGDGRIPVTVLSTDAALADAIHDAAASAHPVATATTLDEAFELAAHGRCGILITDQVATQPVLRRMTQRLREAEPALVVIAVGSAGDQNGLISLLSAGVVDRLMLKPVAPALVQIVLKSAAQQHRTLQGAGTAVALVEQREPEVVLVEVQRHAANDHSETKLDPAPTEIVVPAAKTAPEKAARRIDIPRPPWIAVLAALIAVVGLMGWFAAQRKPAIDAQAVIASNLAAGQRAFQDGHALEPRGRSAFDYYNTVLALDPANVAARQGIDQIADRFAAEAGVAIARGQVAAAIVAVESIRRVRPDHRQLAELQAQLDAAQEKYVANAAPAPQPVAKPAPQKTSASASEQSMVKARTRTLAQAADAIERGQLELAGALLSEAHALGAPAAELAPANEALASAQQRKENEELQHLAAAGKNFDEATQLLPEASNAGTGAGAAAIAAVEPQLASAIEPAAAAPDPAPTPTPTPKVARMVRPEYPHDALTTGAEGWVNVSMSITPAGDVLDPRVVETSNATLFNRAALSAVRKWKYEPFAAAEPRRVTVRVEFRMKERR